MGKQKLKGGNLRGGGLVSFIGSIPGRIYTFTMYFALLNLMIVPLGVIVLLFVLYQFTNKVLAGTNWLIDGLNQTIIKAVKEIVGFINDIIDVINSVIG
jgi:hypothetical protein